MVVCDGLKAYPPRADTEFHRLVYTTNAIESVNAHTVGPSHARGHFPSEQVVLKCLNTAIMALNPTGRRRNAGPCGRSPHSVPSTANSPSPPEMHC
ncbi:MULTISPECIES: transposase [unclassified Streptomyces]|uniref:transposase n=1 Tax=unclassified Streptomyces TaxID=2593676 RepID=UPI003316F6F3